MAVPAWILSAQAIGVSRDEADHILSICERASSNQLFRDAVLNLRRVREPLTKCLRCDKALNPPKPRVVEDAEKETRG